MKAYLVACAAIFAFVVAAHLVQLAQGGAWHLREADFVLSSLGTLGMLGWSIVLLVRR